MADGNDTPRHTISNPRNDLTAEYVRSLFDYEPDTGILRWKTRRQGSRSGPIGGPHKKYHRVCIDGAVYYAHRIIHLWVTGEWPPAVMDHQYGDKWDNRWEKIRPATLTQNVANRRSTRRTGFKGVSAYMCNDGRTVYRAYIGVNRKRMYIGTFSKPEAAYAAYMAKAREFFGDYARG